MLSDVVWCCFVLCVLCFVVCFVVWCWGLFFDEVEDDLFCFFAGFFQVGVEDLVVEKVLEGKLVGGFVDPGFEGVLGFGAAGGEAAL